MAPRPDYRQLKLYDGQQSQFLTLPNDSNNIVTIDVFSDSLLPAVDAMVASGTIGMLLLSTTTPRSKHHNHNEPSLHRRMCAVPTDRTPTRFLATTTNNNNQQQQKQTTLAANTFTNQPNNHTLSCGCFCRHRSGARCIRFVDC
jgi:hypothetical protein